MLSVHDLTHWRPPSYRTTTGHRLAPAHTRLGCRGIPRRVRRPMAGERRHRLALVPRGALRVRLHDIARGARHALRRGGGRRIRVPVYEFLVGPAAIRWRADAVPESERRCRRPDA